MLCYCFQMIRILQGDCRQILAKIKDASIDCALVDPPYGQTSLQWDARVPDWPAHVRRVLKPTGSMWVFGSMRMFMECASEYAGWKLSHDIVWEKQNGAGFFNDRFRGVHEHVAHFYRSDVKWRDVFKCPQFSNDATARTVRRKQTPAHWTGERKETHYLSEDGGPRLLRSVVFMRNEHGRATHPTQKPESLVELLLRYSCPESGIVLDPFAGSGTVGVVANLHNRHAILIEQKPEYVAMAHRRCFPEIKQAAE